MPGSVIGAILDLNLAGEMSLPVAQKLTRYGVPFLFCTGYDQRDLPPDYENVPFVRKPASAEEIRGFLETMLSKVDIRMAMMDSSPFFSSEPSPIPV